MIKLKEKLKNVSYLSIAITLVFAAILVCVDQLSKTIIENQYGFGNGVKIEIIKNFLYITPSQNAGAAWGVGQGQLGFFVIITLVALVIYGILLFSCNYKTNKLYSISLSLIISGTIGNFIDRLFKDGLVTDFIDTYIFGYDYPIFNIADSCLCVGVALLIIHIIFGKEQKNGNSSTSLS